MGSELSQCGDVEYPQVPRRLTSAIDDIGLDADRS